MMDGSPFNTQRTADSDEQLIPEHEHCGDTGRYEVWRKVRYVTFAAGPSKATKLMYSTAFELTNRTSSGDRCGFV